MAQSYQAAAERIIQATLAGNNAYEKLEQLCLGIGHRFSGSKNLEKAIDWAVETMVADGHENVRTDKVMVPRWVRGRESLTLVDPRHEDLPILVPRRHVHRGDECRVD